MPADAPRLICVRCRHLTTDGALSQHALRRADGRTACLGPLDGEDALTCPGCGAMYPVMEGVAVVLPSPRGVDLEVSPPWWPAGWSARAWQALLHGRAADDPWSVLAARVARYAWSGFGDQMAESAAPWGDHVAPPLAARALAWACPPPAAGAHPPHHLAVGAALGRELWLPLPAVDGVYAALDLHLPSLIASKRLWEQGELALPVPIDGHGRWRVERVIAPPRPPGITPAWVCADVCDPPFEAEVFGVISALNVLDAVRTPYIMLGQCHALLAPMATLLLASPFTWRAEVTPVAERLCPPGGDAAAALRELAAGFSPPLTLTAERAFDWLLRYSDAEATLYRSLASRLCRA